MRRILLPIDSTGEDVDVLKWVIENVHRAGDQIVLLHVYVCLPFFFALSDVTMIFSFFLSLSLSLSISLSLRIPARFPQHVWGMYDDSFVEVPNPEEEKKWREDCAKYVAETLLPILDQRKIPYKLDIIAYEMNNTSIGEVVCEKASILDADVIVMASHRKGRIQEFFVGSVTNYALHHSKVPLIVYKTPKETKKKRELSPSKKEAGTSQHTKNKAMSSSSIDFEKATIEDA